MVGKILIGWGLAIVAITIFFNWVMKKDKLVRELHKDKEG